MLTGRGEGRPKYASAQTLDFSTSGSALGNLEVAGRQIVRATFRCGAGQSGSSGTPNRTRHLLVRRWATWKWRDAKSYAPPFGAALGNLEVAGRQIVRATFRFGAGQSGSGGTPNCTRPDEKCLLSELETLSIPSRVSGRTLRQQGVADLFAVKGLLGHKDVKSGAEAPESLPEAGEIHPLKSFRPAVVSVWGRALSWGMRLSETGEMGPMRTIRRDLVGAG